MILRRSLDKLRKLQTGSGECSPNVTTIRKCLGLKLIAKVTMNLTLEIPDDIATRLTATGGDLSRRALEALLAEEYRHDRLTKPELQRLLGIETSYALDGFLKAHDIWIEYTREDAERERQSLHRLGF